MDFIECTNCKTSNSVLYAKCKKCGSILQSRVPNLNLFETMWEVIEKPKDTFRRICLSEQKNYVFLMFSTVGIGIIFTLFWLISIGDVNDNLLNLLITGLAIGPFIGTLLFFVFSILTFNVASKIFRTEGTHRNVRAAIAYALVPVILATIFILPAELIVFGIYLFTSNPTPAMIKPGAFYILISLDILSIIYSFILFYVGMRVANNTSKPKALMITLIMIFVFFGITIIPMVFIGRLVFFL